MAGFKTHITTSSILGIGYGAAGVLFLREANGDIPYTSCLLATGLCGVSGMLPDLDSDSGIPLRETIAFGAAVIPMLMMDRFQHLGMSHEAMVLAGGLLYLGVRFGFAKLLKKFTVHRGMFHSIPAMLIAGLLGFLICSCDDLMLRYYRAGAVIAGFASHLILDEIYSIEWYRGRLRLKKSFGTALKFRGSSRFTNFAVYAGLAFLCLVSFGDPIMMDQVPHDHTHTADDHEEESPPTESAPRKNLHRIALDSFSKLWR